MLAEAAFGCRLYKNMFWIQYHCRHNKFSINGQPHGHSTVCERLNGIRKVPECDDTNCLRDGGRENEKLGGPEWIARQLELMVGFAFIARSKLGFS